MIFGPLAKNIAIEFIDHGEEQHTILLPSDYRPSDSPYEVVRVARFGSGPGCENDWDEGDLLVVEAHMIRRFDFEEAIYHTIAENYVVGWFYEETED